MNYLMTALKLEITRLFRLRRTWAALVVTAAAVLAARWAAAPVGSTAVQAGVVLPEHGGEVFWEELQKRSGSTVSFVLTDEETLERMVSANRWDCGLIAEEDMAQRLASGERKGLVTLVTGPGSTVYPLVRETAAAALTWQAAPQIAEEYLISRSIVPPEDALKGYRPLPETAQVAIRMETTEGSRLPPENLVRQGTSQLFRGLTALGLMVWMLLLAMDLGRWKQSPHAKRLCPLTGRTALLLPPLLAGTAFAFCAGTLALLPSGAAVLSLLPYLALWGAVSLLAAETERIWQEIPTLLPFAAVAGFVLSPVLVDMTLICPQLSPLCDWLPVSLYLRSSGGDPAAAGKLVLLAAAVWAAILLGERRGMPKGGRIDTDGE